MPIIKIENLKKEINLKTDNWEFIKDTNCLAFALGLDIPSYLLINEYIEYAYDLGCLYQLRYPSLTESDKKIHNSLSYTEKLELDFQATELFYEEIDWYEKICDPNEWKIAFFESKIMQDFHLYREKEGIWYQKLGKTGKITCHSIHGVIKNPIEAAKEEYDTYKYQRTYRLRK